VTAARACTDGGLNDTLSAVDEARSYQCNNAFVGMLARKLKRFFHQPRDMNLVLTAILTTLVQVCGLINACNLIKWLELIHLTELTRLSQVPHVGLKAMLMSSSETSLWTAVKTVRCWCLLSPPIGRFSLAAPYICLCTTSFIELVA
jgi:hypothetical protein